LKKIGVPFDVRASIVGKEKVDFMTGARVAFNPSTVESYGMAFYEQMIQMPTVALEDQRWTDNFNSNHFFTTNKKNMAKTILALYDNVPDAATWYKNGILEIYRRKEDDIFHNWNKCFNDFNGKQSSSNAARICNETTVKLRDYIQSLNRNVICIDDILSVYTNKHKFHVIYTDKDTYLSKDSEFKPVETETINLFEDLV
jgi:hypothetical protein